MTRRRICKVSRYTFYMDDEGRVHEYRASSRTLDPKTGDTYIEDETGSRKPLEEGLWNGIPGEFCWWQIKQWKREASQAARLFEAIPPNFIFKVI